MTIANGQTNDRKVSIEETRTLAPSDAPACLQATFLSELSHELRSPLNAMLGFAQLLYDGEVAPESARHHEFMGDILGSGRQLLALVNQLMLLANLDAGALEFQLGPVLVRDLMHEVCDVLSSSVAAAGVRLECESLQCMHELKTDRVRLRQVLLQLTRHALGCTPSGGKLCLRVTATGANLCRIEVEDGGQGLGPSELDHMFLPFCHNARANAERRQSAGLELVIARRMVESLGGSVGAYNLPDAGCVRWAVLPRTPV
jgi:signal transduction histidine kinase